MFQRKRFVICFLFVIISTLFIGCGAKVQQFETTLDNGNVVSVSFMPSNGYELAEGTSSSFEVVKNGVNMVQGTFVDIATYDAYDAIIGEGDDYVTLLEKGMKNNNPYIFYKIALPDEDIVEYDCILALSDSNIAVLMGSTVDQDTMDTMINLFEFSVISSNLGDES